MMYIVKPYYTFFPINVPTNMYKVSNYFECNNVNSGVGGVSEEETLNKLISLQDYILSQQNKVLEKIKAIKQISNTPKASMVQSSAVQPLAKLNIQIYLNPLTFNDIPTSLIIMLKIMTTQMKNLQIKIYKHSSYIKADIYEQFKKLLVNQSLITDKAQIFDLNIIFKTNQYPLMLSDITRKLHIIGEINILQLLWRMYFTGSYDENEEIYVDTIMESFLKFENNKIKDIFDEKCVQKIVPKDNSLHTFKNHLSLIDIYLWSYIHKILTSKLSIKLKESWHVWFTNCSKQIKYFDIS